MKTKPYFLLTFFFLVNIPLYFFSQEKIHTEIEIRFEETNYRENVIMYPYATIGRQTVYLNSQKKDTMQMNLKTPLMMPFNRFFFPELAIKAYGNGKEKELKYDFTMTKLTFELPPFTDKIVLDYKYQGDLFFKTGFTTIQYLLPHIYSWNSWYFTCEDLLIDQVKVEVPEELYFFANDPYIEKENTVLIIPDPTKKNKDISFIVLAKKYYDKRSFTHNNAQVDLYRCKGAIYSEKDSVFYPGITKEKHIRAHTKILKKAITKISDFLEISAPLKISVADKHVTEKEKISWGTAFNPLPNESFILIDSLMWNTNSLYHELLHAYDQNLLDKCITDSAFYYFFRESVIEYLSIYLRYSTPEKREEAFNDNMFLYANSKSKTCSVIGIKDNYMTAEEGPAYTIYQKTPFVMYCFSKKIGEKRFISIFKEFYRQARKKKEVSFKDFEEIAKKHGVTDKQWKWFTKYL